MVRIGAGQPNGAAGTEHDNLRAALSVESEEGKRAGTTDRRQFRSVLGDARTPQRGTAVARIGVGDTSPARETLASERGR